MAARTAGFFRAIKQYALAPPVKGNLLYANPNPASRYTGLHGTQYHKIEHLLDGDGVFPPQGEGVYVYRNYPWNAARAAMWGKRERPVIVEVGSDAAPLRNSAFNTLYFAHPENGSSLRIQRVWEVTNSWIKHAWENHGTNA